jgi:hypothetical protein
MRTRYLLGVIAVLVLILAIWLVPLAFAAAGSSNGGGATSPAPSQTAPSGTQCPFLQAHPWLDPHSSGDGSSGTSGTSYQGMYY